MMFLDLSELEEVFRNRWFWSVGRPNLAFFKREDYLGPVHLPLDTAVRNRVEAETGRRPDGPVRMLTHLRYFGHGFNPVTFYFCYDATDSRVETVMPEITNTPWHERHAYVLPEDRNEASGDRKRYRHVKRFHISPFMGMDIDYDWRFTRPGQTFNVHMICRERGETLFDATLRLRRREIDGPLLSWILVKYPFMTMKVVAMIYWQAFRLWLKRAPYYEHPMKENKEGA